MRALALTSLAPFGMVALLGATALTSSLRPLLHSALTGAWHATAPAPLLAGREVAAPASVLASLEPAATLPETPSAPAPTSGSVRDASAQAGKPLDMTGVREAIAAYRKGDIGTGDDAARTAVDPLTRDTLEWVAIRLDARGVGLRRLERFEGAHAGWPAMAWLRRQVEEVLWADNVSDAVVRAHFTTQAPETVFGRLALARAAMHADDPAQAVALVRSVWREGDLSKATEAAVVKEFPSLLGRADHKFRADRLTYKDQGAAALRAAALAGPDVVALVQARLAVNAEAASDSLMAAVPKPLQADPSYLLARIHKARKADKLADAVALMLAAPRDPALLVSGDEWWIERRLLARKLLDLGDAKTAYVLCDAHGASSAPARIEAEFHAGWIALRYLDDSKAAAAHFAVAAGIAESPMSVSRTVYWQGRAAEASGDAAAAEAFYAHAAVHSATFYGQLAGAKVGRTEIPVRLPATVSADDALAPATRVVAVLYAAGAPDLATQLAMDGVRTNADEAQVAALARMVAANGDATATLAIGKAAAQRNIALDEAAFPISGIPAYEPLDRSADPAVVYSIARQESSFDTKVVSSAGAKGLMQLIESTARATAKKAGVVFDEARLLTDGAFNARIGAAHLGQLLDEQDGSYILTFAAYNAGGRHVKEWIEAHGDPRRPGVDPIDWIERIPFTETRNYVQRIMENLQVYRARLGTHAALLIDSDLRRHGKGS